MPSSGLKARQINLLDINHIKLIIAEIESEQNKRRKREAWRAKQCLEGNQREYVIEELKKLYPKTYNKFRLGDINITDKVNNKLAKSYKNPPIRKTSNDTDDKSLTDIYDTFHFDRAFSEGDKVFNLQKYVCMWLTWQNPDTVLGIDKGSYVLHALQSYEYDLIRDQVTGVPLIFILNYADLEVTRLAGRSDGIEQTITESQSDTSAQTRVYTLWDKENYVKVEVQKADGHGNANDTRKDISVKYLDQKPNIIKRLPIAYLQADTSVDYPVKNNLYKQSIDWNVAFSDLKTAAATQGHGQLVVSAPEGQKQEAYHMGMHTAIYLPQSKKPDAPPTDAKYISAQPDLTGQLNILKFDLINILDDHDIKTKGAIEGGVEKFASGFDRLLSEADVQDVITMNQNLYAATLETEIFNILKAYESAMNSTVFKSTETLTITFEKPKVMISDKETLDNIEKREKLGLDLPWEKHIIMNPNLTEDEAKKREEEIQKIRKEKLKETSEIMGAASEEDPEEDIMPPNEA